MRAQNEPLQASLGRIAAEAAHCQRCDLWRSATQTVFGEGPVNAPVAFVGEQPGDKEDLAGRPFVGPAGLLLNRALHDAGIDRDKVYVTNAVKHFKNEPRGKKRLHKTPDRAEIEACRWWLEKELALLEPRLTVALGATAARALIGKVTPVNRNRGLALTFRDGRAGLVTIHPSALLRLPDPAQRRREYAKFVEDLRSVLRIVPETAA